MTMKRLLMLLTLAAYAGLSFPVMIPLVIANADQNGITVVEASQTEVTDNTTVGDMLDAIPEQVNGGEPVRLVQLFTEVSTLDGDSQIFAITFMPDNTGLDTEDERNKRLIDKIAELYDIQHPGEQIAPIHCDTMEILLITSDDNDIIEVAGIAFGLI